MADAGDHEPAPVTVHPEDGAARRLAAVDRLADQAMAAAGITGEQVRAVTVATPGIVDAEGTVTACRVIRAGDWVGEHLRTRVSERFPGAAVLVDNDNDSNLAVLAEQRFGVAGDAGELVAVFAGRRVGFGILHGGNLHRGAHHQAGEAANILLRSPRPGAWAARCGHAHAHRGSPHRGTGHRPLRPL